MDMYDRPLKVGKTGSYTLELHPLYLDGEVIATSAATQIGEFLTVNSTSNTSDTISVNCTGDAVGEAIIEFEWTTATRSDCKKMIVKVEEC